MPNFIVESLKNRIMSKRKTSKSNLENKRVLFLEIGFIIAIAATFAAFEYKSYDDFSIDSVYFSNHQDEELMTPILLKKKEPIPKKPQSHMALNTVPDDEITEDFDPFDTSIDEDDPIDKWSPPEEIEDEIDELIPSYAASIQPEFPGGEPAMLQFLAENFKIPRIDVENGISGTIYVGFVVNKEGYIENVVILRSISNASDVEALRVVNMMPRWRPGQQSIRKVSVQLTLPIKVKLI